MEETGMVLKHVAGISFDFTPEETLFLFDFISVYREALMKTQNDTEPYLERVLVKKEPQDENEDN